MFGYAIVAEAKRFYSVWNYPYASSPIKIFPNYHIPSPLLRGASHFDKCWNRLRLYPLKPMVSGTWSG